MQVMTPFALGTLAGRRRLPCMSTAMPFEQDPVQLRQRAQECCHEADVAFDPTTRDTLFALARAFEQLARLAEAKGPAPERCQHGPTRQGCRPGQ